MKFDVTVEYTTASGGNAVTYRGLAANNENEAIDKAVARAKKRKAVLKINGGDVMPSKG